MKCIDETAYIHPTVSIGHGVIVGPHSRIGAHSRLDAYSVVGPHTTIGENNHLFSFAVIGGAAQDHRTPVSTPHRLECGDGNIFREGVTISRGTEHGGGLTRIGDRNLFMANSHVGHDSHIGHGNTLSNGVSLAGHVTLEDGVTMGGHSAVHQFARLGRLAFIAANAMVSRDVPPFCRAAGDRARLFGMNTTGLRRAGMSDDVRRSLSDAYKRLFRTHRPKWREQANSLLHHPVVEVVELVQFCLQTQRGLVPATTERTSQMDANWDPVDTD